MYSLLCSYTWKINHLLLKLWTNNVFCIWPYFEFLRIIYRYCFYKVFYITWFYWRCWKKSLSKFESAVEIIINMQLIQTSYTRLANQWLFTVLLVHMSLFVSAVYLSLANQGLSKNSNFESLFAQAW